ncbi:MAG TPA: hypothetical protein VHJ39_13425 [Solirubrobacteraceae bacterium]|nr:hypothetical protein [Solirubrobacteraceae bacterium]
MLAALSFATEPRRLEGPPAGADLLLSTEPAFDGHTLAAGQGVILRCP